MKRLVVVGGGISGLAAAWSAHEAAHEAAREAECPLEVIVLEREPQVGGKARTLERPGWLLEAGPTGFLDNEPTLDRLVEIAGLTKLPAQAAAARRYLVHGGRMREIRPHPLRFAASGILSPLGLMRLGAELLVPARRSDEDESVWEFARRRLGAQAADRMIAPMVLGVFAGDARRISLPAAFPRMRELESEHGSLIRAMIALQRGGKRRGGPAGPGASLTSFAGGLQRLPEALASSAPFTVRTGVRVSGIDRIQVDGGPPRWSVQVEGDSESIPADALVLAVEPWAAAPLVAGVAPRLAAQLEEIVCPPVAVVSLGYGPEALKQCPQGFGALIPRGEGQRILGVLWDTHLFPDRSAPGTLLLRAMLGGRTDTEVGALSHEELARIAHDDVARLMGLSERPIFEEVVLWPRAIPQYELGHGERVKAIEDELAHAGAGHPPNMYLAGNYLHGVAFGKAAAHGWRVGSSAAESLFSLSGVHALANGG